MKEKEREKAATKYRKRIFEKKRRSSLMAFKNYVQNFWNDVDLEG